MGASNRTLPLIGSGTPVLGTPAPAVPDAPKFNLGVMISAATTAAAAARRMATGSGAASTRPAGSQAGAAPATTTVRKLPYARAGLGIY